MAVQQPAGHKTCIALNGFFNDDNDEKQVHIMGNFGVVVRIHHAPCC